MGKTQTTALALLFAFAAPLFAQTTEEGSSTNNDDLAMGVPAEGGVGKPYVAGNFEAWEQRCLKTELSSDPCELYYLLKDDKDQPTAEFSMYSLPAGSEGPAVAGATFMAPLETLLTAGVTMAIDDQPAKAYPFTVCTQIGCVARIGFTAEEVEALKSGSEVTMTLVPFVAPDSQIGLKMSLAGFTAGMEAVDTANAAADAAAAAAAGEGGEATNP